VAANETKAERLNRELEELLQGLRVLLPGVQVLFAFLLTVPFTQRFETISGRNKALFMAALASAAAASAFLIAPSAFHRMLFRDRDKEWLVLRANLLAIVGTVFLAIAMTCALFLVGDVVYGSRVAGAIAGVLGLLFVLLWYVVPGIRRARN
jgi:hypothetical protein